MAQVDRDVVPLVDPERGGSVGSPDRKQRLGRNHASAPRLAAGDPLELAELLERVDADVRVGADAERDPTGEDALDGQEAVAEIGLGRRARADPSARPRGEIELAAVGVGRVHDRGSLAQATGAVEELDRPDAVLGDALLDLAGLLVGVHVKGKAFRRRVAPDLLQPVRRARPHGVRCEPDGDILCPQILDLAEVLHDGALPEAWKPAARVRGQEDDDADLSLRGGFGGSKGLRETEVVELPDGGEPRRASSR